jgi:putative nucleotidyltransferase with HDIG domain
VTDPRRRILFVDDEPAILAGLQNLLYKERKRWDMVFAGSGDLALAAFRAAPFDVVVSDMRMPGMDGATLLGAIRDEFPSTVRIMLSGHAERETIVRVLPSIHQLLSKPCDAQTLRTVIERCLDTEATSRDAVIRSLIGRLDKLPSPPEVYFALAKAMAAPNTTLADVSRIVQRDPGICAKVLQLVNSAYFGQGRTIASIEQAVSNLGTERLKFIAMTASVFSSTSSDRETAGFSLADLQETSIRVGALARKLLGRAPEAEEAFVVGLLHDVGRAILALGMTEVYGTVVARARDEVLVAVERELIGVTHAEVGAALLRIWGLPVRIVDVIQYHHEPLAAPEAIRDLAVAVHVASALVEEAPIDREALAAAGYGDRLSAWCAIAETEARAA